ncbi:TVP38/TMEM64 family protein [Microlunatus sp. GCM10028923]|uniref:TVP38/TMEM64 family protein n=1 Tax=Microlunatus sp. GCM10028923 TaxID=3273400 RepID=UPI00362012DD
MITGVVRRAAMRHPYLIMIGGMIVIFLALFAVVEASGIPVLTDPQPIRGLGRGLVGLAGVGLLVADVLLPVPSSGIMIMNGAVYGPVAGAALSMIGGTGATLTGYLIGRRSRRLVGRLTSAEQRARANRLLDRYGLWLVIVTRPVPILAETVALMAGTGAARWWQVTGAGAIGTVVPAIAYALVGASAGTVVAGIVIFLLVLLLATVAWLVQWLVRRRTGGRAVGEPPLDPPEGGR